MLGWASATNLLLARSSSACNQYNTALAATWPHFRPHYTTSLCMGTSSFFGSSHNYAMFNKWFDDPPCLHNKAAARMGLGVCGFGRLPQLRNVPEGTIGTSRGTSFGGIGSNRKMIFLGSLLPGLPKLSPCFENFSSYMSYSLNSRYPR